MWGVRIRKMPPRHALDYVVLNPDNTVRAWVEIKVRHMPSTRFPTQWIDFFKWCVLARTSDVANVPVLLVYSFTDGLFMFVRKPGEQLGKVELGGRKDRGDKYDIKPVININIKRFERLRDPIQAIQ